MWGAFLVLVVACNAACSSDMEKRISALEAKAAAGDERRPPGRVDGPWWHCALTGEGRSAARCFRDPKMCSTLAAAHFAACVATRVVVCRLDSEKHEGQHVDCYLRAPDCGGEGWPRAGHPCAAVAE